MRSLAFLVFAMPALAQAGAGAAGCGLGSLIWTRNTVVSQTLASTTNPTSFENAMYFKTSNCTSKNWIDALMGRASLDRRGFMYAESNYRDLLDAMARGDGEQLRAFAASMGCEEGANPAFGRMARERLDSLFPAVDTPVAEFYDRVTRAIRESPELSARCLAVI